MTPTRKNWLTLGVIVAIFLVLLLAGHFARQARQTAAASTAPATSSITGTFAHVLRS